MLHIIVLIDSVFKSGKSYYPETLIEDRKYKLNEKTIKKYITKDLIDCDSESEVESNYKTVFK